MGADPAQLLQFAFSGVTQGSLYAFVALSLVLVYRASAAINFAQGEFIILGALIAASVAAATNPFVAVLAAVLSVAALGAATERVLIRRVPRGSVAAIIALTIGLSLALRGLALVVWGSDAAIMDPFTDGVIRVGGAALPLQVVWIVGVGLVVLLVLWWFLEHTMAGLSLRSVADDPAGARVVGIDPNSVSRFSWAAGAALAGLVGALLAPLLFLNYESGTSLMIKGFVALVIGGFTSTTGVALAGLLIGVLEGYVVGLVSSDVADGLVFTLLIGVLLLRPQGLFGRAAAVRP
ncbi:branched-chain amino acid ABC transporter permease [Modestobacter lapidis]|nr:branched-chain amino acid ABC transporter permease [Modestobacter lapidis]